MFSNRGCRVRAAVTAGKRFETANAEITFYTIVRAYNTDAWHVVEHGHCHRFPVRTDFRLKLHEENIALSLERRGPERCWLCLELSGKTFCPVFGRWVLGLDINDGVAFPESIVFPWCLARQWDGPMGLAVRGRCNPTRA